MKNKLKLLFLWHMHQPYYKDDLENRYFLPYVRLHSTKDYLDMLLKIEKYPKIKQTFNLVPSLLEQIQDYIKEFRNVPERDLHLSYMSPEFLSTEEKKYIIENFFKVSEKMLNKFPQYRYLYEKVRNNKRNNIILENNEILDLQVFYNLSWIDPIYQKEQSIDNIIKKSKNFTQKEKEDILDFSLNIIKKIIPTYKTFAEKRKIEISMTPFYHPIMPLIIDNYEAKKARFDVELPKSNFRSLEDAKYHIEAGKNLFKEIFDFYPKGVWPSEGSVSDDVLKLLIDHNFKWFATDEDILKKSYLQVGKNFSQKEIYRKNEFVYNNGSINGFFRNHMLSDLIGFVYSNWDAKAAAKDFIKHLEKIYFENENPIVSVILDGENCWEFYDNDGNEFLDSLYEEIEIADWIETVTPSEIINENEKSQKLYSIASGSWINSNFDIWLGHNEKNKAWELLYETRKFLEGIQSGLAPNARRQAWKEIYIAEGSDWFWWFGDNHFSENDEMFDYLFRKHLINVYLLANCKVPDILYKPIKVVKRKSEVNYPMRFLHVNIDGTVSTYLDWLNAGFIEASYDNSSIHKTSNFFKKLYFGFNLEKLFLRLDFENSINVSNTIIKMNFRVNEEEKREIIFDYYGKEKENLRKNDIIYGWKNIFEVSIPFSYLNAKENDKIKVNFELLDSINNVLDKIPNYSDLVIIVPTEEFESEYWSAI